MSCQSVLTTFRRALCLQSRSWDAQAFNGRNPTGLYLL